MKRNFKLVLSFICVLAILLSFITGCKENTTNDDEKDKPIVKESEFAAENLFDFETSSIKTDSGEKLTVGIIGGTETTGTIRYDYEGDPFDYDCNPLLEGLCYLFRDLFPNRSLKVYDMSKYYCGIVYAAAMFDRMLLQYSPDIIFIASTLADLDTSEEEYTQALESIITRAASAEKVPVICIVSMPSNADESTEKYQKWQSVINRETKIAEKYGLAHIDVISGLKNYAGDTDFKTFINEIMKMTGEYFDLAYYYTYDVIKQFILNKPAEFFKKVERTEPNGTYTTINVHDSRLSFEGDWHFWDYDNPYDNSLDISISYTKTLRMSSSEWLYPLWPDGVADGRSSSESVSLTTDADKLYLTFRSAKFTAPVTVYVDGQLIDELRTKATTGRINEFDDSAEIYVDNAPESYMGNVALIKLPGDGQKHDVKLVVGECDGASAITFQLGYIIEYKK